VTGPKYSPAARALKLDVHDLDFLAQEQQQDWFLQINPKGEVPTLVTPSGKILTDSAAILVYLAGKIKPEAAYCSTDVEEPGRHHPVGSPSPPAGSSSASLSLERS